MPVRHDSVMTYGRYVITQRLRRHHSVMTLDAVTCMFVSSLLSLSVWFRTATRSVTASLSSGRA